MPDSPGETNIGSSWFETLLTLIPTGISVPVLTEDCGVEILIAKSATCPKLRTALQQVSANMMILVPMLISTLSVVRLFGGY
jgi:hypothetical protein